MFFHRSSDETTVCQETNRAGRKYSQDRIVIGNAQPAVNPFLEGAIAAPSLVLLALRTLPPVNFNVHRRRESSCTESSPFTEASEPRHGGLRFSDPGLENLAGGFHDH